MKSKRKSSALIERRSLGLSEVIASMREKSRYKRIQLFKQHFPLDPETRLLDLGGWDGSHVNALIQDTSIERSNVFVADIDEQAIELAHERHGFIPVLIPEDGMLPYPSGYFDVVFCSSVLEHVTVPKSQMWDIRSGTIFREMSIAHQKDFADEIRRLGKAYYIQVPYRDFPIETHTWLPFIAQLPRSLQINFIRFANKFWIKQTIPDFYLPTESEMRSYFSDAQILWEKQLGFRKSLIAIKAQGETQ
ncbi:MAG: methyltransferase domain-containing protein [Methylobacter sp.]|uniref:class I SAM-dependent methyltransferase n=1 Tax=Methylicorpusculum sp. TaxID=2713644 RepID=UPI00272698C9|nr:methyltransferase domain-containing protein [Methylicorpusculum sp.]MDO9142475.1 methyltransferase domain-containing protein [Methylobacter sp.]MDP2178434.1 methyltransferase domain-containing protein [Methylicorpusculum sp.]MDP2429630.1 methyltransferase domain-containing protein [Methylobacter sp.]MDP3053924.1 methyltransferase domain-containing protein [Methylobacter sp.]MDP3360633.1 methyltransferase domain-containing protein [Methylobacter sp.]